MNASANSRFRRRARLHKDLKAEAEHNRLWELGLLSKEVISLQFEIELMKTINQQLQSNWMEAQERINLLTTRHNELAAALADGGLFEIHHTTSH